MVVWVPIHKYAPGWFEFTGDVWEGLIRKQPAWTDGNVMMIGELPPNAHLVGQRDFSKPLTQAHRTGLYEIKPAAVAELGTFTSVIFSDGLVLDAKYYNLIHALFPVARWFSDANARSRPTYPVRITESGRTVAAVCALKAADWNDEIESVLKGTKGRIFLTGKRP